jgi:alpha-amylase
MDYETFGEHQWADTGIFEFMKHLPGEVLRHKDNNFMTPSELVKSYPAMGEIDIHNPISWADIERDLSAWRSNQMQIAALKKIYEMEEEIMKTKDQKLIQDWRKLQTSDHYYYMCTKWFADGDVHKYFNPYDSPYDSYIAFMNIVNDFAVRIDEKKPRWSQQIAENMKRGEEVDKKTSKKGKKS